MPRETYKDYANEIYEKVKAAEAGKKKVLAGQMGQLPLEEYPLGVVQVICEIFTGKPCAARPERIYLPEGQEPICLVLSSKKTHYYRTTPDSCSCKGWKFSSQKYGVGKCRHHTLAFPAAGSRNEKIIEEIETQPLKPRFNEPFRPCED